MVGQISPSARWDVNNSKLSPQRTDTPEDSSAGYSHAVPRYSYDEITERIRALITQQKETPRSVQLAVGISKDKWSRKMRGAGSTFSFEEISLIATFLRAPLGWPFVEYDYAKAMHDSTQRSEKLNEFLRAIDDFDLEREYRKYVEILRSAHDAEVLRDAEEAWFAGLPPERQREGRARHDKVLREKQIQAAKWSVMAESTYRWIRAMTLSKWGETEGVEILKRLEAGGTLTVDEKRRPEVIYEETIDAIDAARPPDLLDEHRPEPKRHRRREPPPKKR